MDGVAKAQSAREPADTERAPRELTPAELAREVDRRLRAHAGGPAPAELALLLIRLARHDGRRRFLPTEETLAALESARGRVAGVLQGEDRYCVLGPNEILVYLARVPSAGIARLAMSRVLRALAADRDSPDSAREPLAAVGAAMTSTQPTGAEALVGLAEKACAAAVEAEERQFLLVGDSPEDARAVLAPEVRAAIEHNRLEVHYQPQWHRRRGTCASVEALVRWPRTPGAASVATDVLVDVARRSGLMQALTRFVLNNALREVRELEAGGIKLSVAVNLEPALLGEPDLPGFVEQALSVWGVSAQRLTLEVTESSDLRDSQAALRVMHQLRDLGTRLSIDDFGTGHSSIARLRALPLAELKIDRMFVFNMERSREDLQIVRSVIDLAHNFELEVVAEGVENAATARHLCELDCDIVQGYVLARPMPADALRSWWLGRRNDDSWLDHAAAPAPSPVEGRGSIA